MDTGEYKIPAATIVTRPNPFTIKSILKCIYIALELMCVAFLLELIIAGAILRIPIKLLSLWAILLLVSTVVPRHFRKYFYLTFLAVLTCITVWTFNSDGDHTWQPSTFDAEMAAFHPDVDSAAPNAADIYQSLLDEYDGSVFHPNLYDFEDYGLTFTSLFPTESYPILAEMVRGQNDLISKLLQASQIDLCLFPLPVSTNAIDVQHRRIAIMKCWARQLLNSANNDLGDGFVEPAMQKQFAALKMADHLYQQRTVFDNSGAIYIELMAYENINSFIMNHCKDALQLDLITARIKLNDEYFPENWNYIYDSLKLVAKNMVGLVYETHPDGRTRRSQNIAPTLNTYFSAKMRISPYQMSIVKAGAVGHWFILPGTPYAAAGVIDRAFEEYSPAADLDNLEKAKPKFKMNYNYVCRQVAYYCSQFYYPIRTQSRRRENAGRSTRILLELKKYNLTYGTWPDDLDCLEGLDKAALVDTVNDLSFVYKPKEDSFILYSIGRNKEDDGSYSSPKYGFDDIRYWPEEKPEPE